MALIHILGGGQWQLPTIRLAKSLGHRVLVTDRYSERPGYALSDAYEVVDITDMDATLRVAERNRVDAIVCDTTDVGVPTMAYIAEELGLPGIGYEVALNFTDKYRMRTLSSAAGVPNPPFRLVESWRDMERAESEIGLPLVIKPVDSQASRGVHIIRQPGNTVAAYSDARRSSRSGRMIAEGFLDGTEVTVEGYCLDGCPLVAGISDKDHFPHRPEVANRLTYPADFPPSILSRIVEVNAAVVRALGLRTGVTHAEYMVVGVEVYLVEIAARGGGSRVYSDIAPHLAGVPIPQLYLDYLLGGSPSLRPDGKPRAANLAFFDFPAGKVKSVRGVEEARNLPGVLEVLLEFGVGDLVQPPSDDRSRAGMTVVLGSTRREVMETTAQVFDTVQVEVE